MFISLDIFKENLQNKGINSKLDAWLTFFSSDKPETITELYELDRNTERYMFEEMQEAMKEMEVRISELGTQISELDTQVSEKDTQISAVEKENAELKALLRQLQSGKN